MEFNIIRGSSACANLWKRLPVTLSCCTTDDPMFQQMMLSGALERLLNMHFPIVESASSNEQQAITLSKTDEKVVRYIAGYIPVSLRKKLERSSNPHKEEFILCLWSMCEDDSTCDDFLSYTKAWISRVDRGGLFPVNNTAYLLFKQLEIEVQKSYK